MSTNALNPANAPTLSDAAPARTRQPYRSQLPMPFRGLPVQRVLLAPALKFGPGAWSVTYDLDDDQGTLSSIQLVSSHPPRDPWGNIDADALFIMVALALQSPDVTWQPDVYVGPTMGSPFVAGCRTVLQTTVDEQAERVSCYARGLTPAPSVLVQTPRMALSRLLPLLDLRHTLLEVRHGPTVSAAS